MTKEQYLNLKGELKELAKEIRQTKNERREKARTFSFFEKNNGGFNDYYEGRIGETQWLSIREDYNKLLHAQVNSAEDVTILKREFREKHIAYCLARGRTLKEIEPHNKEGNEIDAFTFKSILKKYEIPEKVA